jgi:hypothetical protein
MDASTAAVVLFVASAVTAAVAAVRNDIFPKVEKTAAAIALAAAGLVAVFQSTWR